MDAGHFDAWTKRLMGTAGRRGILRLAGSLSLGGLLASLPGQVDSAAGRQRRELHHENHRKGGKKRKHKNKHQPKKGCFPGKSCTPGAGKNASGCDLSGSVELVELNLSNANLSKTNLTSAQLLRTNLSGANLSGACLVGANLLAATIDSATNLDGAIFCKTLMPDGSIEDRDCGRNTACCATGCEDEVCSVECSSRPGQICSVFSPQDCCPGLLCTPTSFSPLIWTCQGPCGGPGWETCAKRFGPEWGCDLDPFFCLYLGLECCSTNA